MYELDCGEMDETVGVYVEMAINTFINHIDKKVAYGTIPCSYHLVVQMGLWSGAANLVEFL